jgi:3-phenylpropionate/trans-cinnamate dioxygenase ferredoxin subunit
MDLFSSQQWYRIANSFKDIRVQANGIGIYDAGERKICIARFRDEWFAFNYKCPHASGIMADGFIDAIGNIVCPVHRYRFNLRNGRNSEGYFLKVFALEEREDGVYVKV